MTNDKDPSFHEAITVFVPLTEEEYKVFRDYGDDVDDDHDYQTELVFAVGIDVFGGAWAELNGFSRRPSPKYPRAMDIYVEEVTNPKRHSIAALRTAVAIIMGQKQRADMAVRTRR